MTSFDPIHPKNGAIIELLAEHQSLKPKELLGLLKKERNIVLSIANFYKILGQMVDEQILVKTKGRVSINMTWATYAHKYTSMMQQKAELGEDPFPAFDEGETRIFNAESLDKIDPIWTHLVLYLFTQEKDEIIRVYEAHPWYLIGRPGTELRMYDSCYVQGKKINMLLGNKTFLDKYGLNLHKTTPCNAVIADESPFAGEGYTFWLCGDYIIECIFPDLIAQYFTSFFNSTKKMEDFDLNTFTSIFHIKVPTQLRVTRDKKKAETLRKKFDASFEE